MPLNEARGFHTRAHLNREQRTRAEADLLGISPMSTELNYAEIERMRSLVAQHDAQHKTVEVFDLNNPPQKPYVYREFPRMVFHHANETHKVVKNHEELAAALKAGYAKTPKPVVVEAEPCPGDAHEDADADEPETELPAADDPKLAKSKSAKAKS